MSIVSRIRLCHHTYWTSVWPLSCVQSMASTVYPAQPFYSFRHRRLTISSYGALFCWRVFLTEALALREFWIHLVYLIQFSSSYCSTLLCTVYTFGFSEFCHFCSWLDPKFCPADINHSKRSTLRRTTTRFRCTGFDTTRTSLDISRPLAATLAKALGINSFL